MSAQYQELQQAGGATTLTALRGLSADALVQAQSKVNIAGYNTGEYVSGDFYWGPYVDGKVLPNLPNQAFANGAWSKVPLLLNHDAVEGTCLSYKRATRCVADSGSRCWVCARIH